MACFNHGQLIMSRVRFQSNQAQLGGVFYITDFCSATLVDCTITNNTASSQAGAFYMSSSGTAHLFHTEVSFNKALDGEGGGAAISDSSRMTSVDSSFISNTGLYGGAIYLVTSVVFAPVNTTFSSNSATFSGGAVMIRQTTKSTWQNCTCNGNIAGRDGGCFLGDDRTVAHFTHCKMEGNRARNGGALALRSTANATGVYNRFNLNQASLKGGATFIGELACYKETNSALSQNCANTEGGGMAFEGSTVSLVGLSFCNNTANIGGALAFSANGHLAPRVYNCTLWLVELGRQHYF